MDRVSKLPENPERFALSRLLIHIALQEPDQLRAAYQPAPICFLAAGSRAVDRGPSGPGPRKVLLAGFAAHSIS